MPDQSFLYQGPATYLTVDSAEQGRTSQQCWPNEGVTLPEDFPWVIRAVEANDLTLTELPEGINPDITAPTIQLLGGAITGAQEGVELSFTLRISDVTGVVQSTINNAIVIEGPGGQPVARTVNISGPVTATDALVALTPDAGAIGLHNIRIESGVQDVNGNTLGAIPSLATFDVAEAFVEDTFPQLYTALSSVAPSTLTVSDTFVRPAIGQSNLAKMEAAGGFDAWAATNMDAEITKLQVAVGGTGFKNGESTGRWDVNNLDLIKDTADRLSAQVAQADSNTFFSPYIWSQGEADSNSAVHSEAYEERFLLAKNYLETETGLTLPWITYQLNANSGYNFKTTTRAEQVTLAQRSDIYLVNLDDIAMASDLRHYPDPPSTAYLTAEERGRTIYESQQLAQSFDFKHPRVSAVRVLNQPISASANSFDVEIDYVSNTASPVNASTAPALLVEGPGLTGLATATPQAPLPADANSVTIRYTVALNAGQAAGDLSSDLVLRAGNEAIADTAGNSQRTNAAIALVPISVVPAITYTVDSDGSSPFVTSVTAAAGLTDWVFSGGVSPIENDNAINVVLPAGTQTVTAFIPSDTTKIFTNSSSVDQVTGLQRVQTLEEIRLQSNNLTAFPEGLDQIPDLATITLNSNQITEIPAWVLTADSLRTLLLSDNELAQLPDEISIMADLTTLYVNGNQLTELPSFQPTSTLRKLWVQDNQLTATALEALLDQLAAGTYSASGRTLIMTGNPGSTAVSQAKLNAAISNGWGITNDALTGSDTEVPTVAVGNYPNVATGSGYSFELVFSDDVAIDVSGAIANRFRIAQLGAGGITQTASSVSFSSNIDGSPRTATVVFTGGTFDAASDYQVSLLSGAVQDTSGNSVAGGDVGGVISAAAPTDTTEPVATLVNSPEMVANQPYSLTIEFNDFFGDSFGLVDVQSAVLSAFVLDGPNGQQAASSLAFAPETDSPILQVTPTWTGPFATGQTYQPKILANAIADRDGNAPPPKDLGAAKTVVASDSEKPVFALGDVPIMQAGTTYSASLIVSDNHMIDISSLNGNRVRLVGGGESRFADSFVAAPNVDTGLIEVTFTWVDTTVPFDPLTTTYEIAVTNNAILDISGNGSLAATVGTVSLPNELAQLVEDGGDRTLAILSGQSNWRGHPLATPYTGTLPTKSQVWDGTDWALYTPNHHAYETPMHPTLAFVLEFEARYPALTLYVVESGMGGVGFQDGAGAFATGGSVRTELTGYIADAIANLNAAQQTYHVLGFSFWQGEKDTEQSSWANAYQAELTSFLADIDTAAGVDTYKLITRIHDDVPQATADVDTVRAAHVALAAQIIDIDGYTPLADSLHFAPADYTAIGQSYLDAFETIAPIEVIPPVPPQNLDVDFRTLSALPAGWTLDDATVAFNATDGVIVTTTVSPSPQWTNASLRGPVVDWTRPIEFYFKGLISQNGLGVSQDPGTWLTTGQHSIVTIWSALYQGNTNIKTYPADMVAARDYRFTLTRNGADIEALVEHDLGSGLETWDSFLVVGGFAGVDGAIIMADPKTEPVKLQRVVN